MNRHVDCQRVELCVFTAFIAGHEGGDATDECAAVHSDNRIFRHREIPGGQAERQAVGSLFWTTHLLLLGAWTGGLLNLLGLVRGSVYSQRGARAWASRPFWPWLFGALCVGAAAWAGLAQGEGPRLLLSAAAQCLGCYALWTFRVRLARLLLVVVSLLWLVYDVLAGSIPGTLCEVLSQISLYVAIARDARRAAARGAPR